MITNDVSNPALDQLKWQEEQIGTNEVNGQMGQADFFALLTSQLAMQDPLNPTTNEDMISQMTQFTMSEGISDLGDKFDQFSASMTSNQALEASSLVGRNVLVNSSLSYSDGTGISGQVPIPSAAQTVNMRVFDESGNLVKSEYLGDRSAGMMDFEWDGSDEDGNPLPPGQYKVEFNGFVAGESEGLTVLTYGNVSSVTLGQNGTGLELNLQGLGAITLSDVLAVGD
ncbi:MAG: flagellar basal-body rod modification protein FlgD [Psychrosphaera sp.]|jgi:flagellar basal-body rod modification protein FlgD|uniref:Basal-body rod modification protein FlgD n=1 Tax=Psychrosphaera aquimarina TaxID=2044854 RepID=A0ABU3R4H8_9GAMM|nr:MULTISPECIES: flagellar hook assembly protein FlgD [Psychrosphaera]MBU2917883.1 flagellar hook assembly protein FlgD [Psychrosphaera sp. F3M07]MDU0114419.1 flagellar hook assembly protein FlgD [Psychrosphaera aquimarina]